MRTIRGKIVYLSHKQGSPVEYGRERFSYSWHPDGQCTIRSVCEIERGVVRDRHVVREVTYSMDRNQYPLDCFVRLHEDGVFLGSGWFRFSDRLAECEVYNRKIGRITQRVDERVRSFGAHALTCDMTHCARYDHTSDVRIQQTRAYLSSLDHDGCSGPLLSSIEFGIEYAGRETITVPAGTFETDHYLFHVSGALPEEHPTEEVWCMPGDLAFVKIKVGGYMNSTFELAELEEGM
ncbi:MAG TPA: hypothetical protein VGE08_09060 [Steroidobacter sp.]|uniref:hypothetical protein n=1 Tax=Steroidobacter sp. TaxID=1978227 RepID=UPI002EDB5518